MGSVVVEECRVDCYKACKGPWLEAARTHSTRQAWWRGDSLEVLFSHPYFFLITSHSSHMYRSLKPLCFPSLHVTDAPGRSYKLSGEEGRAPIRHDHTCGLGERG